MQNAFEQAVRFLLAEKAAGGSSPKAQELFNALPPEQPEPPAKAEPEPKASVKHK